jgi:hypothetical protein
MFVAIVIQIKGQSRDLIQFKAYKKKSNLLKFKMLWVELQIEYWGNNFLSITRLFL